MCGWAKYYKETAAKGLPNAAVWCYYVIAMKHKNTMIYSTPIQLKLPVDMERIIKISDPVYSFNDVVAHIDLYKYFAMKERRTGRPEYDRETLFKIVLFAFMEYGYCSVRRIQQLCDNDIRFLWLLDGRPTPSVMTIQNFIHKELSESIQDIFTDINSYIFSEEHVDTNHVYIDGTKLKANAGNYTWVWKKSCIRNRNKVFCKITELLAGINEITKSLANAEFEVFQEYSIERIDYIRHEFLHITGMTEDQFVHGSGKRKSTVQKLWEQLTVCEKRLKQYSHHIAVCGDKRNSYSKTDRDATFMRVKRDYMGNDQLLPSYNIQVAVCDEYIAQYGVYPYASDMDCFQPLMDGFQKRYGYYPQYPVADAGYGSLNNYLYCEEKGMEKYMKFPMFEKENKDSEYRENPYRASNFQIDEDGDMVCPNGRKFHFLRSAPVKGNRYGRTEEFYQCESCDNCPHREKCHRSAGDRIVRVNEELTAIHSEVLTNLNSIHGILLRVNRSVQAEGTFGSVKWNRDYNRIRRRGQKGVLLEIGLISCGFNLHKYHLKHQALRICA